MTSVRTPSGQEVGDRWGLWPLRILWFVLPLVSGPGIGQLFESRSAGVSLVAEAGLWVGWFVGLVSLLAPSTVSLTALRILAPIMPIGIVAAALVEGDTTPEIGISFIATLIVTAVCFLPTTGDHMVNGSSYGAERRLALRPPAGALLGPVQVAWLACALGITAGPLLLGAKQWLLGAVATAVGIAATVWGGKALHQLATRWVVFVPVGFVIHDYYVLAESVLLQRKIISQLGPAPAQPEAAADLSGGAMGLALQVDLSDPISLAVKNKRTVLSTKAPKLIFTPSLPGRLLAEARVRGLKLA